MKNGLSLNNEILTSFCLFLFHCSTSSPMTPDPMQKSSSSASSEASETCQSVSECSSPTSVSSSSTAGAWSGGEKVNHPYPSLILSHPGLRNQQVNAVQHIRVNQQSMCLGPISTPPCDTVSFKVFASLDVIHK